MAKRATSRSVKKSRKSPKRGRRAQSGGKRKNGGWVTPRGGGPSKKRPAVMQRESSPRSGVLSHVTHACTVTNPFCQAAKGSKFPDGSNGTSIGYQVRGHLQMGGNSAAAGGVGGTAVAGGPTNGNIVLLATSVPFGFVNPNGFGTSAWGTGPAAVAYPNSGFVSTNAVAYRIVSAGAIIRGISAVTNSQGYLILGTSNFVIKNGVITSGSSNYLEQTEVPITAGMEHCWIAKPNGVSARAFKPLSAAATNDSDWTSLTVEMIGTAGSNTIIDIEYFFNVECQLLATNSMAELVPVDPRPNPAVSMASKAIVQKTSSFIQGGVKEAEDAIWDAASTFMGNIAKSGLLMLTDGLL